MLLENIAWFVMGVGVGALGTAATILIWNWWIQRGAPARMAEYIGSVQEAVTEEIAKINAKARGLSGQEISRLQFRDRDGVLCAVDIVVDHDLIDHDAINNPPDRIKLVAHRVIEDHLGSVEQFVFAGNAVNALRANDMHVALDEVVRELLKDAGRI